MWTCPPRTPSTRTAYRVRCDVVERSLEVIAAERSVGGIGLAVERDRQEALLVDVDHNERHDHPNPHGLAVVAPIRHSCVDHAHSPIVSTVRCVPPALDLLHDPTRALCGRVRAGCHLQHAGFRENVTAAPHTRSAPGRSGHALAGRASQVYFAGHAALADWTLVLTRKCQVRAPFVRRGRA